MSTTTVRSWPAIVLGTIFAAVTGYVLLEDVFHGAPVTVPHLLTTVAIIGTIAAGHMIVPQAAARKWVAAFGLVVLFLAGTGYTVISAGARNAEVQAVKAAKVRQANTDRADVEKQVAEARRRHREAEDAAAAECATGKRGKCEGRQATVTERASHVAILEARLERVGPAQHENAGYRHAGEVFATVLPWSTQQIERTLVLTMPFLLVLICEWGTLVFWSVGLGHRDPDGGSEHLPDVPDVDDTDKVLDYVQAFQARNGRKPKIPELQAAFEGLPKTTAWRKIKSA